MPPNRSGRQLPREEARAQARAASRSRHEDWRQGDGIREARLPYDEGFGREDSVELGRLANTTARLTAAFQEGMLHGKLRHIKTGASQTVTVRHITASPAARP